MVQSLFILLLGLPLFALFYFTIENPYKNLVQDIPVVENGDNQVLKDRVKPQLIIRSATIPLNSDFNPLDFVVSALDQDGNDIKSNIVVYGEENVDTTKKGVYNVRFTVRDSYGLFTEDTASYIVD